MASVDFGTYGIPTGKSYVITTFTMFLGALQVPVEQADHVVVAGLPLVVAVSQLVSTVSLLELRPGYCKLLTKLLISAAVALQFARFGVFVHEVDPRTMA
jgi:hypothetical protein